MQLQVKQQKTAKTTYLEGRKQQVRYCLTYLEVLKEEKGPIDVVQAKTQHQR